MPEIIADFTVDGIAEPKGSVRGFNVKGRVVIVHGGNSPGKYKAWVRDVTAAAKVWQEVHRRTIQDDEPIAVDLWFYLPRPKSASKRVVYPIRRPDIDKLARLACDCIVKAGLIADDARIVDLTLHKRFATDQPYARVIVKSLLEKAA
jgi:Holliday junction resolvase RusA-like endonuclease